MPTPDQMGSYLERFYKEAINGKKGNLFTRVEWLEELIKKLQVGDTTNFITQLISENKEIIQPSVHGGTADPTDPTFSGIVISPSGQLIDGILYSFAIVIDGVVFAGFGDDGGTPVIVTGGDVVGDTVPTVAGNAAVYTDTSGKHISDSGARIASDGSNVALGTTMFDSLIDGIENTGAGDSALDSNQHGDSNTAFGKRALYHLISGNRNIALGLLAGSYETGSDKLFIDSRDRNDEAGDRAGAILYGEMDDDPDLQVLNVNGSLNVTIDLDVVGSSTAADHNGMTAVQVTDLTDGGATTLHTHAGSYTDEQAQDAIGAMVDGTLIYTDATPLLSRAALTGDVTASAGSNATTIANDAVTLAKMANMATASLIYRKTAGTGDPEVNTLATVKTDLGLTGTNSGDQTITLTGDVTGSGTGSFAATIANGAVTAAKTSITGTPDGTKYLRDDFSWQAVSGGTGLTQPQVMARLSIGF